MVAPYENSAKRKRRRRETKIRRRRSRSQPRMSLIVKSICARRLDYRAGLELQKLLTDRHHLDTSGPRNAIIFCEHNPVYTIGIRDKSYTPEEEAKLISLGADFCRTNRGGLITFHGPGQLVVYPIINLRAFQTNLRCYVSRIEKMIVRLCAEFGIKAGTTKDTGIWVEDRKICAIGIHASRYVTSHGLALNVNTDLGWFDHIVPCGLEGKTVTSISKEVNAKVSIDDVLPVMKQAFQDEFGCSVQDFSDEQTYEILQAIRKTKSC